MNIDTLANNMDEDCRAAAIAYAVKSGSKPGTSAAFIEGAAWALKRIPGLFAAVRETETPAADNCQQP